MTDAFFVHQVKHNKTNDTWDKGIVVKADPERNNESDAKLAYHAYLGAYAYGHDVNIDYVECEITSLNDRTEPIREVWYDPA